MTKPYSLLENLLFLPTFVQERRLNTHLQGKTILLSGASFGIGECLALRLAKSGATLLLVARTEEKLIAVQQAVIAAGGKAAYFAADLTKEEDLEKLIAYLTALPNGIDIFINNKNNIIIKSKIHTIFVGSINIYKIRNSMCKNKSTSTIDNTITMTSLYDSIIIW